MLKLMAPSPKRLHCTCSSPSEKICNNLPSELLSEIAKYLGIKDLISFRAVCKDWLSASYTCSAQIESSREPWLLHYPIEKGSNNYKLYNHSENEMYVFNTPELEGTICLASDGGWLLLTRGHQLFFFCPFSRAKIELPEFPHTDLADHVAAFTCFPTSQECVVAVINRCNDSQLELHLIKRGENVWNRYTYVDKKYKFGQLSSAATYCQGEDKFYYMDWEQNVLTFSVKKLDFAPENMLPSDVIIRLEKFYIHLDYYEHTKVWNKLKMTKHGGIQICGTMVRKQDYDFATPSDNLKRTSAKFDRVFLFHPRFHQIPPGEGWSV